MKATDQIVAELAYRIGLIYYHRPLMYGGTPAGVELLLWTLHSLWAFAVEREEEFDVEWRAELEREDCGAFDFSYRYSLNHPQASEDEIVAYTVKHWAIVSDRLNVPIPHARLKAEFGR